jgi:hypothetical protein
MWDSMCEKADENSSNGSAKVPYCRVEFAFGKVLLHATWGSAVRLSCSPSGLPLSSTIFSVHHAGSRCEHPPLPSSGRQFPSKPSIRPADDDADPEVGLPRPKFQASVLLNGIRPSYVMR